MSVATAKTWGAEVTDGGVRFRLWAPSASSVRLVLTDRNETIAMQCLEGGWYECTQASAGDGTRYHFEIDGDLIVPDPASRFQPDGLDGPSLVVDPARFSWPHVAWSVPAFDRLVFYELHVGTFTPEGTYAGVQERLGYLRELGVTAIELMPLAEAPGAGNWGYDGVLLYAPTSRYGSPDDLKRLISAAHACGIAVFLDVVYNHFGPQGNYLSCYARQYFTNRRKTPWGDAIDYTSPQNDPVRRYAIENARYWLTEYRFDGLRLDAVHAVLDDDRHSFLRALAAEAKAAADRTVYLVLENDANEADLLADGYDAQWNDDVHHALHVTVTGDATGYYSDFASDPVRLLGRALTGGFAYQGEVSAFRGGVSRGSRSDRLPLRTFVNFLQNHDQVGNRAFGERITQLAPPEAVRAAAAIVLLAPSPPLLFMGEEWATSSPFLFFCDFEPELAGRVTEGRRNEFKEFPDFSDAAARERIPDPNAAATFRASALNWAELQSAGHREWLEYFRGLLHLRRTHVVGKAATVTGQASSFELLGARALRAQWRLDDRTVLHMDANLSGLPTGRFARRLPGNAFFPAHDGDYEDGLAPPWSVRWSIA